MTKVKRLLAVVVALSFFACSAVTGFAASNFSFPSFSRYDVLAFVEGSYPSLGSDSKSSGVPFSSISLSSSPYSYTSLYFYLYGSDYGSSSGKYSWDGFKPGFYTGSLYISDYFDSSSLLELYVLPNADWDSALFDSSFNFVFNWEYKDGYIVFEYFIPYPGIDFLYFCFNFSSYFSSGFVFTPSILPDQSYYNVLNTSASSGISNSYQDIVINIGNSYPSSSKSPTNNDIYYFLNWFNIELYNQFASTRAYMTNSIHSFQNDFLSFSSKVLPAINNLTSYFLSQKESDNQVYKNSVPDGLKQQQQEAQNQLTDYEKKEQAVFDNLNTSLDTLNLNQYSNFSPSIVSSMTFINGYVTKAFDGLGDFKIILFLPMVLGIGLAVIGRMGHMISNRPTRSRGDDP